MASCATIFLFLATCSVPGYALFVAPMENGVMVKRGLAVHTKVMEWRVTFTLDDPSLDMAKVLIGEVTTLMEYLSKIPLNRRIGHRLNIPHWTKELTRIESRTRTLVRGRNKRALLPIIGSIARDLFGTATTKEVKHVMKMVLANRNAMNKIVNFGNEQLTLINITKTELEQNRKAINEIITTTSDLHEQILNITVNTHTHYYLTYQYNLIQDRVSALWQHLDELQAMILQRQDQRDLLEQGRLGEQLIDKETLKEVASLHATPGIEMVTPIEWYYTYCRVFPIWNQDLLAFMVRIPLVEKGPKEGY